MQAAHLPRSHAYSPKGAALTLLFSFAVMGISAWVLIRGATEQLTCRRDSSGRPTCRLARQLAGVSIPTSDLGVVRGARVETMTGRRRISGDFAHTVWVTFETERGDVSAFQRLVTEAPQKRVVAEVTTFIADPASTSLMADVGGDGAAKPWVMWCVFGLGAAILVCWTLGLVFPGLRPRR